MTGVFISHLEYVSSTQLLIHMSRDNLDFETISRRFGDFSRQSWGQFQDNLSPNQDNFQDTCLEIFHVLNLRTFSRSEQPCFATTNFHNKKFQDYLKTISGQFEDNLSWNQDNFRDTWKIPCHSKTSNSKYTLIVSEHEDVVVERDDGEPMSFVHLML